MGWARLTEPYLNRLTVERGLASNSINTYQRALRELSAIATLAA